MKVRLLAVILLLVGLACLVFAFWQVVKHPPPSNILFATALALIILGGMLVADMYPEQIDVLGVKLTLRAPMIQVTSQGPPPAQLDLPPQELEKRKDYTVNRFVPGSNAGAFDLLADGVNLTILPSGQPMVPMYLLDKEYRILDWNDAFSLAFDATMEGRRGVLVIEWVYFLKNWQQVVDHGLRAFSDPNNLPSIDVETVEYENANYGLLTATKRAYRIPADDGSVRAWLVILDVMFKDQAGSDAFNLQLIERLRNNLMWSEYAVSYDNVLTNTFVYPDLLKTMAGERGSMQPVPDNSRVLDLGAGTGNLTLELADPAKSRCIFAVENNRVMLNVLHHKCRAVLRSDDKGPGVIIIQQDIRTLYGLLDDYFDCVFLNNVLYSLPEPGQCLEEVFRVLRPGGEVRISGPKKSTKLDKLFARIKKDLRAQPGKFEALEMHYRRVEGINRVMLAPFLYRWEAEEICGFLRKAGFSRAITETEHAYAGQSLIVRGVK